MEYGLDPFSARDWRRIVGSPALDALCKQYAVHELAILCASSEAIVASVTLADEGDVDGSVQDLELELTVLWEHTVILHPAHRARILYVARECVM